MQINQKLADSLKVLKKLQDQGLVAIKSSEIGRVHRERLLKYGFLKEVIKGWYILSRSDEKPGDTTSWNASYWKFCARYLSDVYGEEYFISPDQSLIIHSGNYAVPKQLLVRSGKNTNYGTELLNGTSIWHWDSAMPEHATIVTWEGIRMMDLPSSLINCSSSVFTQCPIDVRAALAMIKDASEITSQLLKGGNTTIAGRLAGAFENIGRDKIADEIVKTMQAADYPVRKSDPFESPSPVLFSSKEISPYVNRMHLMWQQMREVVIAHFPKAPGLPKNHEVYMNQVEEIYVTDAYNSLSIERYSVTPELIERVRTGSWNVNNEEDRKQKDAMAARGYWLATQKVQASIKKILNGINPGKVADDDHGDWYRELFAPSVAAGIIEPYALAGYRNDQVYISNSQHTPPNKDAVRDLMPEFFELLRNESEASVRAVLGHFIFVFIHPYKDGNGRMGRFLMNVMLASGGYPWSVILLQKRADYMKALEQASAEQNIESFTKFLAHLVDETMKGGQWRGY